MPQHNGEQPNEHEQVEGVDQAHEVIVVNCGENARARCHIPTFHALCASCGYFD